MWACAAHKCSTKLCRPYSKVISTVFNGAESLMSVFRIAPLSALWLLFNVQVCECKFMRKAVSTCLPTFLKALHFLDLWWHNWDCHNFRRSFCISTVRCLDLYPHYCISATITLQFKCVSPAKFKRGLDLSFATEFQLTATLLSLVGMIRLKSTERWYPKTDHVLKKPFCALELTS